MLIDIIRLLRPKQWTKNLVIFAAIIFSGELFNFEILTKTIVGFIIFCGISSSVYILNDIIDVEKDKAHHKKKFRPIAVGKVSILSAIIIFAILFSISLIGALLLNKYFCGVIVTYFIINMFYIFLLKHIVIVDVLTISFGFFLRAVGGSVIANSMVSNYLIICTILLALFLALNKRRSEKLLTEGNDLVTRTILESYSVDMIDKMLSVVTSAILFSYLMFAMDPEHSTIFVFTTVFVIYGLFRYIYIADKTDLAESPEYALLHDKPLLINVLLWVVISYVIMYIEI